LSRDQRSIVARQNFAGQADNAVAVMITLKVRKGFFADQKLRVLAVTLARGVRQSQGEPGQPGESPIFRGSCWHTLTSMPIRILSGAYKLAKLATPVNSSFLVPGSARAI